MESKKLTLKEELQAALRDTRERLRQEEMKKDEDEKREIVADLVKGLEERARAAMGKNDDDCVMLGALSRDYVDENNAGDLVVIEPMISYLEEALAPFGFDRDDVSVGPALREDTTCYEIYLSFDLDYE